MNENPSLNALPPKRPGGLTALAVLNIILACLGVLGGFAMTAFMDDPGELERQADEFERAGERAADNQHNGDPELNKKVIRGMAAQMRATSPEAFRWMFAAGMTGGVLLFVSGIGLLGQRRLLGRHAATGAALALIFCAGVAVAKLGFMFWGIPMLGAAYAIVLLALIHSAYRRVLVR